jgi:hypothetical protein
MTARVSRLLCRVLGHRPVTGLVERHTAGHGASVTVEDWSRSDGGVLEVGVTFSPAREAALDA